MQSAFMLEILRDVVERALEPFADFFNLLGLNHKRWRKHEPIADDTQHEAMTFRGRVHSWSDGTREVEWNALVARAHERHAENEALPPHIPANRILAQPSELGLQHWA